MNEPPIPGQSPPGHFLRLRMAGATLAGRLLACLGALAGILGAALATIWWSDLATPLPMLLAPIGASAVLVFAVPSSPLAQPWAVIGGNSISALVGWVVAVAIASPMLAAAIAVAAAILVMTLTRSLHPPGGATALTAVLLIAEGGRSDVLTPLLPIALNSLALVATGLVFHRLTGRSYPHRAQSPIPMTGDMLRSDDIRAALDDIGEAFDVTRSDLDAIYRNERTRKAEPLGD